MRSRLKFAGFAAAACLMAAAVNSCTHPPQAQQTMVSFRTAVLPILEADCAINSSCHLGANGANDEVDLDTAQAYGTLTGKNLVSPADPTASLLYVEISTGVMPKAPYARLSNADVALVLLWIKQGAQNN